MNAIIQTLLWCPVQVTVLALAALAIGTLAGRRRPAVGAWVAVAALLAVVGLTATALSPTPAWKISWDGFLWNRATATVDPNTGGPAPRTAIPLTTSEIADVVGGERTTGPTSPSAQAPAESFFTKAWGWLGGNWIPLAAVLYLIGVIGMGLRIVLGLAAVRGYRRHSHPITDRRLGELADVVCAELGCTGGIELRETTRLSTPATIGWLRPMLLLPADWRSWTADERHAVLAHEIEHVRRNDFASWMAAQVGVALHFYHPLVHWLANRLRLQQELAADAAAARVVGGQRKYVTTLAAMALRQSESPVAWPARAFLPTSKTFLRRIEMLHRSKSLRGDASRPVVFVSVAAVLLAAACAAGLRGSVAGDQPASAEQAAPLGLALNQADPPAQAKDPAEVRGQITKDINHFKQLGLAMHNYYDRHKHFPPAVVMGPDGTPHSWRVELLPYLDETSLYKQYRMNEAWDSEHNKKVLEQMPEVFRSPFGDPKTTDCAYYVLVGPGTIFEGAQGVKFEDITDGTSNTLLVVGAKRGIPWTKPEDIAFDPDKPLPELGGFVQGEFAAAFADGSARRFYIDTTKDYLKWLIMRNDGHPIDGSKMGNPRLGRAGSGGASSSRTGDNPVAADPAHQTMQNLKHLMLAMHNYHDIHGRFPPAVVMGPDGKTPHSWRVELLPVLDLKGLYEQYKMNEPWDSLNNLKVLAQMPDVFRSPYNDPKSANSGYFGIVGRGTVFEGPEGIKIRDITDGTSNTLMLVESKRDIPWTKPEDIAFDSDKPMQWPGGFVPYHFYAALADGSVRSFEMDRVKDNLKWLIMRNDGHPIERQ
jgi:beta-lactamase regulating signal transducer with metallopeptidase domain